MLRRRDQRAWLFRLEREHDNLRAARRWLLEREDDHIGRGSTLLLVATPDVVVERRPAVCSTCQLPLAALQAPVVRRSRRTTTVAP